LTIFGIIKTYKQKIFQEEKRILAHKCVIYSIYYVTYVRLEEIEEAPSSSRGE
jgi:hypothetical protein